MSHADETDPIAAFEAERAASIARYRSDAAWQALSARWMEDAFRQRYMYNFAWLGRPIIQLPQDIVAMQEAIWTAQPDLIIETGIAHGGSLVASASLLALIELCEAATAGRVVDPRAPRRKVLGVDIDIRAHNRAAIEAHPLSHRIEMIEGSSVDARVIAAVKARAAKAERVLVCLDSHHGHDHVLRELEAYAPLTSAGSYCLVLDGIIEDLPANTFPDRPWGPGDNPKTAVREYLRLLDAEGRTAADGQPLRLAVDEHLESKLMLTVAPSGYLRRT